MNIIEIIKYLLPCITITLIAYWLINRPIKLEKIKVQSDINKSNYKILLPIKLSAFERVVLFLERITPEELLNREMTAKMSCFELQIRLLEVIRNEFEHNVSQQIYINVRSWQAVVATKNNIIQLINICSSQTNPNDRAIVLAQTIIKTYNEAEETPIKNTIELLKAEIGTQTSIS